MKEVEGGNNKWLMRILRHEAGHAIDTEFGLRRRKAWRRDYAGWPALAKVEYVRAVRSVRPSESAISTSVKPAK